MILHSLLGVVAVLSTAVVSNVSDSERPQLPVRPFPYAEVEVTVRATPASPELAGTLTCPRGDVRVPAVILVQGGSPFDRDGTFASHKPLLVLSDAWTRAGFATLRLDDRGVGQSKGQKLATSLEELASDLEACVAFLRARNGIRGDQIGLVGHSGGALACALVASRDAKLAFVVLLGCPARPLPVLVAPQLAADGDGDLATNERFGRIAADIVCADPEADALASRVVEHWNAAIAELPEESRARAELYVSSMSRKLPVLLGTRCLRDLFCFDPAPSLRAIRAPVLALWGELDQGRKLANTSASEMARHFAEGAAQSFGIVQVSRTNHFLQTCDTGGMDEIARIRETISPEVLRAIVDWGLRCVE